MATIRITSFRVSRLIQDYYRETPMAESPGLTHSFRYAHFPGTDGIHARISIEKHR